MKVAILSDVHGNLRALENVLNSNIFKTVDKIILLGDLVDYGPHSNEVVELLSEYEPKIICNIIGNHEEAILKQDYSRFSSERFSFFTPPLYFNALTVATITTASGRKPVLRHLISRNFSAPRSAPKPASVTT